MFPYPEREQRLSISYGDDVAKHYQKWRKVVIDLGRQFRPAPRLRTDMTALEAPHHPLSKLMFAKKECVLHLQMPNGKIDIYFVVIVVAVILQQRANLDGLFILLTT